MNISTDINIWIGAFLTVSVFSILFRDNIFYKFAEALFIGVSAGYFFSLWLYDILIPKLFEPLLRGELIYLVPLFLGLSLFLSFNQKTRWISKIPIAFAVGIYAGVNFIYYLRSYIILQISSNIFGFVVFTETGNIDWATSVNNIIVYVGVVTVLLNFLRTYKSNFFVKNAGNIGMIYIMIALGTAFGYTVMSRMSILIGRIEFLFNKVFGIAL